MKKRYFIVFILFMFILCINVNAEIYYGEYKLLEDNSLINNYQKDEILVEEKKLFNTYKEEYKDLGYMLDNDIYIKDENDFIEEYTLLDNYVNDSDEYINIKLNKEILNVLRIENIKKDFKIYEIIMYYNDEEISYRYFYNNFKNFIRAFDGKYDTYNYSTKDSSFITFVFEEDYLLENIKIVIYTDNTNINFDMIINSLDTVNIEFKTNKHIITFDEYLSDTEYKYGTLVKKNRYYDLELVPTNNYIEDGENIILEDYIIEYDYYIRDKLVLNDDIVIKDINSNISDFIEYSTGDVKSVCNINYNVNGEYYCNFILDDINVNKKVLVDIKSEEVDEIKKEEIEEVKKEEEDIKKEEVEELKKEEDIKKEEIVVEEENDFNIEDDILNLDIENNKTDSNIKNDINNSENVSVVKDSNIEELKENTSIEDTFVSDDIILDNKNEVTKDVNSIKGEEVVRNIDLKKDKLLSIIKYIFIILVILIEVILFIKKKKNKSNVEDI